MSSTSELLGEITGYQRLLAIVEAYRTDYASRDAEMTIRIVRDCIELRQQEISKVDTRGGCWSKEEMEASRPTGKRLRRSGCAG